MSTSNKNDTSKSNDDLFICEVNVMLQNIKTADEEENTSVCANCGKDEVSSNSLKACMACKMVLYCNDACKKKHRYKHNKACREHLSKHTKLIKMPPSAAIATLPAWHGGARGIAKLLIADNPRKGNLVGLPTKKYFNWYKVFSTS